MKYFKQPFIVLFMLFIFLIDPFIISAEPISEPIEDQMLDEVSLHDMNHYWQELVSDYGGFLPELEKTTIYELIKSNGKISVKNVISGLLKYLGYEFVINGKLLGSLLMLTLFSVVLQTMHNAFEQSSISKIAYFVVYIVLIFIALNSFYIAFSYTQETIETMSSFMIALIPLMLGLIATFGHVMTISFFHPIIILLMNVSGVLVSKIILPLLFLSALLLIVSSLNKDYQVTHLASLLRNIGMGMLGVFLTVFLGIMSVQGTASAIQDGIAMKTTKFITGNFIPVIGRTLTDATDTIMSASLLLKNAVGIVGLIIIVFLALFPVLKILAIALTYKIAAAILQPIGDGPIITTLNTVGQTIVYILACLMIVTLMFFLAIVVIVLASNVTLLLR